MIDKRYCKDSAGDRVFIEALRFFLGNPPLYKQTDAPSASVRWMQSLEVDNSNRHKRSKPTGGGMANFGNRG